MTKIDSRLRQQCSKLCNMLVGVLSLAPCYSEKIRTAGTSPGVPGDILGSYEELRWMEPHMSSPSPCTRFKKGEDRRKKREKFYIYLDVTHTHPARAGSTLKGKRKKKADTRRAKGQKQRRGGKGNRRTSGTNLHGETDLTKTAHAPKPHDTLRRSTRGN